MKSTLFLFLLLTGITYAQLGETRAELEKRYGKPVEASDAATIYEKSGNRISVVIWKERCHCITFKPKSGKARIEGVRLEKFREFSKEDIQALLAHNPEGAKWQGESWDGTAGKLSTTDKKFVAYASPQSVSIRTVAYMNREGKPAKEE